MRVADEQRRTLLAGQGDAGLQLCGDRFRCGFVVEEHIARDARQADPLRLAGGHGGGAGAAVDQVQAATLEFLGEPGHRRAHRGHAAALVVVQALHERHLGQRRVQPPRTLFLGQLRPPGVGTAGRVHRHVQDHRAPALVRLAGQFGGMRGFRDDRQGYAGGQVEDPAVACQVLPEVIDDHGQQRRALVGDGVLAGLGLVEQQAQAQQGNAERRHQLPRVTLRPFSRLRAWLSW